MIERREGHFTGHDKTELFYQSWTDPNAAKKRGTLVITHGISEHSECYAKTAERLTQFGWSIFAWDLRGHGRSEGKRGYVRDFDDFARDLDTFLKFLNEKKRLDGAFALIGHSLGGLITLRHVLTADSHSPKPTAIALSSPALGLALRVPPVKEIAARALNRILPSLTLYNEIRFEDLSRDPEQVKSYKLDPLRHEKISPALYLGMLDTMDFVKAQSVRLKLPILIQAAGVERIVSLDAIKEFYSTVGSENKKLIVYEESYHEIYNDLDREKVIQDLSEFLSTVMEAR